MTMHTRETIGELVDQCRAFLEDEHESEVYGAAASGGSIDVSWKALHEYNADLADDYLDEPKVIDHHFREAISELVDVDEDQQPALLIDDLPEGTVYDVGQFHPDAVLDHTIGIRGQVTKRSKRQLRDEEIAFYCRYCGLYTHQTQTGKTLTMPPDGCKGCEKHDGLEPDNRRSRMTNYQEVRLQTLPEHTQSTTTEEIDVELTGDLVGTLDPGDRAIVNSFINAERQGSGQSKSRIRELYGEAKSIDLLETSHTDIDYDPYLSEIKEIGDADDVYEQVVNSIAPSHHGDRLLKLAIAFAIFGGVEKPLPEGGTKRGNSHIIIIGDPGTGKSDILDYVQNLVPRAEYASGKQTTSAGLTASAVQDDFGGQGWTLEAGTLVRAHEGVALIDELDKMSESDRGGMIEAMSEQQISVHKAASGTLPAKCTVIACCNPKYGRFDPMQDIGQQLDFHAALLSRFDLWFVMEDQPDTENDREIASHMNETAMAGQELAGGADPEDLDQESVVPDIEPELFRAYVAYARTIVPKLTEAAAEKIEDDYVELRDSNDRDGPVPVTARAIEAIHRLSEASARIRLSEVVEEEDVERAQYIRDYCFETMGIDPETGERDALRLETGEPESVHEKRKFIKQVIDDLADDEPAHINDIKEACIASMEEDAFDSQLEKLKTKGEVIERTTNHYRTT